MKKWAVLILLVSVFIFPWSEALADGSDPGGDVSQKLNKVIQTQDQILKELEAIKAELEIIKVRATNK